MNEVKAGYSSVVDEICTFDWAGLSADQMTLTAWAYYYFSVQFRENLLAAVMIAPDDAQLAKLVREECHTANLSPYPGVAEPDEAMNHDEFMARVLRLSPVSVEARSRVEAAGTRYLAKVRVADGLTKAMSIASYEDGGLEAVFRAFIKAPDWQTPLLQGFKHFLVKHIEFDSGPDTGHGALCRHLRPDNRIRPLWLAFRDLLLDSVPGLAP